MIRMAQPDGSGCSGLCAAQALDFGGRTLPTSLVHSPQPGGLVRFKNLIQAPVYDGGRGHCDLD